MQLETYKELINNNRELNGLKPITGECNIELLALSGFTNVATNHQWYRLKRTNLKGAEPLELKGLTYYKDKKTKETKERFFSFRVYDISQTRKLTKKELENWSKKFDKD